MLKLLGSQTLETMPQLERSLCASMNGLTCCNSDPKQVNKTNGWVGSTWSRLLLQLYPVTRMSCYSDYCAFSSAWTTALAMWLAINNGTLITTVQVDVVLLLDIICLTSCHAVTKSGLGCCMIRPGEKEHPEEQHGRIRFLSEVLLHCPDPV